MSSFWSFFVLYTTSELSFVLYTTSELSFIVKCYIINMILVSQSLTLDILRFEADIFFSYVVEISFITNIHIDQ